MSAIMKYFFTLRHVLFLSVLLAACRPHEFSGGAPQGQGGISPAQQEETVTGTSLPPRDISAPEKPATRHAQQAEAGRPAHIVKVALLVPLSGESSALGNAMVDAATLALFDKYNTMRRDEITTRLVIIPKDTGATPE